MKRYFASILQLLGQVKKDFMLAMAFFAPIIVGCLIRFGVPVLESTLSAHFNKGQVLVPYYALFDLFVAMMTPFMLCYAFAMILLEEIDDKVAQYFMVTPLGKSGYLISRVGLPALITVLFTPPYLMLCHISDSHVGTLLMISLLGSLMGMIAALLIVSLSTNKLEGMAVAKMTGLLMIGVFPPFFIEGNGATLFGVLPSYWLGRCIIGGIVPFFIGLFVSLIWIALLVKRFNKKVSI